MSAPTHSRPGSLRRGQAPDGRAGLPPAKICRIRTDSAASDPPTGPDALPVGAIGAALLARQHLGDALPPAAVAGGGG